MAELLRGVSHSAYHADQLPGSPRFSRSVAVTLLQQSPLHAYAAHPALGGAAADEPTESMEKGALVHQLLLGGGLEIARVEFPDWRTKAAQAEREEARERGALPVLAHLLDEAAEAARALSGRLLGHDVILGDPFDAEVTALWDSEGVRCKARFDLYPGGCWIGDLKVQRNLNVRAFEWGLSKLGLEIQAHAYQAALAAVHPELEGRTSFEWLLVERKPPYDVAIIPAGRSLVSLGESKWKRALKLWRECLASGVWPGTGRREAIEARPYELEDEMVAAVHSAGEPEWMKD